MLTIDISIGNYIGEVCKVAARLSRHPLAHRHDGGAYYAFAEIGDRIDLALGPWRKPDDIGEDYEGQAFWHRCREHGLRKFIQAHAVGDVPGVCFDFNGVTVEAVAVAHDDPKSDGDIAQALHEQWEAKMEAAREAYWTPERKAEEARRQAEYEAKMTRRREEVALALEAFPFKPTDPDAYAEYKRVNADGYGGAVVRFGEGWAAIMEAAIEGGATVAEAAEATQYEADCEGITGFQYGCAVRQLVTWWKHGEELRRWHNGKYGHDGDGVVNPAVMTVRS